MCGNIGGFPISVHRFDERSTLIIHGRHEYKANVSDSPAGTIASVEHALESMDDRLHERESDLKQCHKQSDDLTKQLDHPFEHEEKLTVATKRQQEIVTALDITKNQATASVPEALEDNAEIAQVERVAEAPRRFNAKTSSSVTLYNLGRRKTLPLGAANLDSGDVVLANQYLVVFHRDACAFFQRAGSDERGRLLPVK